MKEQFLPSLGTNLRISTASVQGGRQYMEDEYVVKFEQCQHNNGDMFAYFAIFDGHGGDSAARFAKEHLLEEIKTQSGFWSDDENLVMIAIKEAFICTHYMMWNNVDLWPRTRSGYKSTAGTTASVVIIKNGQVYIAHCGDSGIALCTEVAEGNVMEVTYVTEDHKPQDPVECRRIELCGGKVRLKAGIPRVVWNRAKTIMGDGVLKHSTQREEVPFLAVARSLGDLWSYNSEHDTFVVSPEPDVCCKLLDPCKHRCIILASDGLWNMINPTIAVNLVRQQEILNGRKPQEKKGHAQRLCNEAIKRWSLQGVRADNTTVIVIWIDDPEDVDDESDTSSVVSSSSLVSSTVDEEDSTDLPVPAAPLSEVKPGFPIYNTLLKQMPKQFGSVALSKKLKSRRPSPIKRTPRKRKNLVVKSLSAPSKLTTSALANRKLFNERCAAKKSADQTDTESGELKDILSNSTNHLPSCATSSDSTITSSLSCDRLSRCVASQTAPHSTWSTRLRSTLAHPTNESDQQNQENSEESVATADIRGIITTAEIKEGGVKALTESPVKLSQLSGQLGNVAAGLVSSMWASDKPGTSNSSVLPSKELPDDTLPSKPSNELSLLGGDPQSPTTCLSVLAGRNLRINKPKVVNSGRVGKRKVATPGKNLSLPLGVLRYCKRVRRCVRRGYNTRSYVRATLTRGKS